MTPETRLQIRQLLHVNLVHTQTEYINGLARLNEQLPKLNESENARFAELIQKQMEVCIRDFSSKSLDEIAAITTEREAYSLFRESLEQLFLRTESDFKNDPIVIQLSSRSGNLSLAFIYSQVSAFQRQIRQQTELRWNAIGASSANAMLRPIDSENTDPPTGLQERPQRGGRPPAKFWDKLWAAMAGQLYKGELIPKTQADIENAMLQWLENNSYSAADSTVRDRARLLWQSIESDEN